MSDSYSTSYLFVIIFWLLGLVFYTLPQVIAIGKLYIKAGKPFWSAFIPIYSTIVMANIAGVAKWMGIVGGLFFVLTVLSNFVMSPFIRVIYFLSLIVSLIVLNKFIKKYNAGLGWWALWLILPIVAIFKVDKISSKDFLSQSGPSLANRATGAPNPGADMQQPVQPQMVVAPQPTQSQTPLEQAQPSRQQPPQEM